MNQKPPSSAVADATTAETPSRYAPLLAEMDARLREWNNDLDVERQAESLFDLVFEYLHDLGETR